MNWLAHLRLAPDEPLVRLGNLAGDFVRGVDLHQRHPSLRVHPNTDLVIPGVHKAYHERLRICGFFRSTRSPSGWEFRLHRKHAIREALLR